MPEKSKICEETNVASNAKKAKVGEKFNSCKSDKEEVITSRLLRRPKKISDDEENENTNNGEELEKGIDSEVKSKQNEGNIDRGQGPVKCFKESNPSVSNESKKTNVVENIKGKYKRKKYKTISHFQM